MDMYKQVEGGVELSNDLKIKRAIQKYRKLFPLEGEPLTDEDKDTIIKATIAQGKFYLIFSREDKMKNSFLLMLLGLKKLVNIEFMSVYRLLDIYLGTDKVYESILGIDAPYLLLYMGFSEFENKRQLDAIMQITDEYRVRGKSIYLFFLGTKQEFNTRYKELVVFLNRCKFRTIDLNQSISIKEEI